jgi:hypothetical protein
MWHSEPSKKDSLSHFNPGRLMQDTDFWLFWAPKRSMNVKPKAILLNFQDSNLVEKSSKRLRKCAGIGLILKKPQNSLEILLLPTNLPTDYSKVSLVKISNFCV